jgi:hypothetical protein
MSIAGYFRATETETQGARCATHGTVQGTRQIPKFRWRHAVTGVRRYFARRRPLHCPTCGATVTPE